jgi:nucleolar GTP-binding protein
MDLSDLPPVPRADDLVDQAFGNASSATGTGGTAAERQIDRSRRKVQTVESTIVSRLENVEEGWPDFDEIEPFHRNLVDVVADLDAVREALGATNWARRRVKALCREGVRRIQAVEDPDQAERERERAYGRVADVLEQVDDSLGTLDEARDDLRDLPEIRTDVPTLVVAGAPNVGKSRFLKAATTGKPEVAEYPFTTKAVEMGHLERDRLRYQVVDTPGVLDRPLEERNRIERQSLVTLGQLADAVLFLLDPSETCGYSLEEQERLLEEVEATVDAPVVVVENKADLLEEPPAEGRLRMSLETGEGVEEALEAGIEAVDAEGAWV